MSTPDILTAEQVADYERLGCLDSITVLSESEVESFRAAVEETCRGLGGGVTRLDWGHLCLRWAYELASHPKVVDCIEQLIGPNVLLKSTRLFYKHSHTGSFVAWHQDGAPEQIIGDHVPTIWLGLTAATVENGCLRVVPGSHKGGVVDHIRRPSEDNLTGGGTMADIEVETAHDVVMEPGQMSVHHPLIMHGSSPNTSDGPRIGFSATYTTPDIEASRDPVMILRGDKRPNPRVRVLEQAPEWSLSEGIEHYRQHLGSNVLFLKPPRLEDPIATRLVSGGQAHERYTRAGGKRNAVFLWIPKNAGTSLYKSLKDVGCALFQSPREVRRHFVGKGLVSFDHLDYAGLQREGLVSSEFAESAFTFCFGRDPYDRAVSLYLHLRKQLRIGARMPFLDFCRRLRFEGCEDIGLYNVRGLSQCNPQVRWLEGARVDFIGRLESIQEDAGKLFEELGLAKAAVPHLHASGQRTYDSFYCEESRALVEDLYREDFEYFGYGVK